MERLREKEGWLCLEEKDNGGERMNKYNIIIEVLNLQELLF